MNAPHHLGQDPRGAHDYAVRALANQAERDTDAMLVFADHLEEAGDHVGASALRSGDLTPARNALFPPPYAERRKYIEKLTDAELARMPEWVARWKKIGLRSGETTDHERERFRRAIAICYEAHQPKPLKPPHVVWVPSPLVASIVGPLVAMLRSQGVGQGVRQGVGQGVGQGVRQGVGQGVAQGVGQGVGQGVEQGVAQGVEQGVGQGVRQGVGQGVRQGVGQGVGQGVEQGVEQGVGQGVAQGVLASTILENWHRYLGGAPWVGWGYYAYWGPAAISFLLDVCGLELAPHLERTARANMVVAETCYHYWPGKDFVIVSPRPRALEQDEAGLLTRATWDDGWEVTKVGGAWVQNCDVGEVLRNVLPELEALPRKTKRSRKRAA